MTFVSVGDTVRAADLLLVVGANHLRAGRRFGSTLLKINYGDQVVTSQRKSERIFYSDKNDQNLIVILKILKFAHYPVKNHILSALKIQQIKYETR